METLLSVSVAMLSGLLMTRAFKPLKLPSVTAYLIAGVLIAGRGADIEAARARGVAESRVVINHAFKNAMVPFVTILGLQVALLLGGAILTEQTFNWNGIGSQLVRYLDSRDYAAVQGIITFFALAVVTASLLIDIINAMIDPRVRY